MSAEKRTYGLIGYPVKHSFSPVMHNAAFKYLKEHKEIDYDAEYRLFEVKPQDLNIFLNSLQKQNIYGLNVTVPFKEKVLDFVKFDSESFYARQIKAVNTIVNRGGVWIGFNTDIPGFLQHLKENIELTDKKVAVLGAGGAGKAVVYAIASSKAKEVFIYDTDKDKAEGIVSMIQSLFVDVDVRFVDTIEKLDILSKDILINATPVGMKETDPCLIKEEMLHKNLLVYDVIYNPLETKLLKLAKKVGAKTCSGLGMLLHQGKRSFEIWTGKKAPQEVMWEALSSQILTR
ncbi:shikimate dehydrogenase [bacterium]|nr:shikimate dehydrogenase [bacterium]